MKVRTLISRGIVAAALLLALAVLPQAALAQGLFTPVAPDGAALAMDLDQGNVERIRYVRMNLNLLRDTLTAEEANEPRRTVAFNLFEGLNVPVTHVRTEYHGNSRVWVGRIAGQPESMVTIGITNGVAMGNLRTESGHLVEIRYAGGDIYAVRQMDVSGFAPCKDPITPEPGTLPPREAEGDSPAPADDGSTIDVMVVYTQAAVAAVGGTAAMESLVAKAISETNQGYANSRVTQRVNLVHQAQVNYDESAGFSQALNDVTNNGDGQMDEVHAWRDTYKADMVSLWIDHSQYCGLAWLMTSTSRDFSTHAFSVVAHNCATGNYSFAHEMGHNQGCAHEHENADAAVFDYSYGYKHASAPLFRTIMSYACSGVYCPRVNYWSNPDVSYQGTPMGVAPGSQDAAHNAMSLNNTNTIAANWRDSGGGSSQVGLVWRHSIDGRNGLLKAASGSNPTVEMLPALGATNWNVMGAGDFNGDGQSDIAWRNLATGDNGLWLFSNGTPTATFIQSWADLSWELQAVGDLNNDGKADLVWRNMVTGEDQAWIMDGTSHTQVALPSEGDTTWVIKAVADYNGDNEGDLVWRNTSTGEVMINYLSSYSSIGKSSLLTLPSMDWQIFAAADYNSDGIADLFWYNVNNGTVVAQLLDGSLNYTVEVVITVADTKWQPHAAADNF